MSAADPYVPAGPIGQRPGGFRPAERREAMRHVLRGVQLGEHDERVVDWIVQWDDSTTRTIASLIERARMAGREPLTRYQLEVLGNALADALAWRRERAGGRCARCEQEYGGLCYEHAADDVAAIHYEALAAEFGIEVAR